MLHVKLEKKFRIEKVGTKSGSRYAVKDCAIFARFGKLYAVATNGRAAAIVECGTAEPDTDDVQHKIPFESLKAQILTISDEVVTASDGRAWPTSGDKRFPQIFEVWPREKETVTLMFSAKELYNLAQALGDDTVRIEFIDPTTPMRVFPLLNGEAGRDIRGLLMPIGEA